MPAGQGAQPGVGERTILFTDVQGSTELRTDHGDDVANEILATHEAIVREQIAAHGGHVVQFLGDGFFAAFDTPGAAVLCAIDIQRRLDAHGTAHPERRVVVRVGIHHGPVLDRGGQPYGQTVHAAARITGRAAGSQILVSDSVARDAGEAINLRDRGKFWLKGFPERWSLYEVAWRSGGAPPIAASPERTPFVDREEERADLRRLLDDALTGQGGAVLIAGEPGVGKTRLVEELAGEADARGLRVLAGHCTETDGGQPYLPFVELLEQALVAPTSPVSLRDALGDLAPELSRIVPSLRRVLPDLPPPIELPPDQARRYLWNSVVEFVDRAARIRPLMLHLEDLHWADESTLLLLEHITTQVAQMPVLIIGTYRDTEIGAAHPLAQTIDHLLRRHLISRISLRRLPQDGVAGMVRGLASQEPPDTLVRSIHAETDGNPFFVEEVYLHLAESGALLDASGRFRADLRIDELDVPESIRLAVGGRLARLGEDSRAALTAAAVLGRTFAPEVAATVADMAPEPFLTALEDAERVRLVGGVTDDPSQLAFTHELIRQTLLADAPTVARQRLHARAAAAIEGLYADELETHAADLAHHLARSGLHADIGRLARYLTVAGERALHATAFEDAVGHFEHALSLPLADAGSQAELLERLALARRSLGAWDGALEAMDDCLSLYEELGRTDDVGRLCAVMVYQLAWASRYEEAARVAGRGLAALGDARNAERARLQSTLAWVLGLAGDYPAAMALFDQARAVAGELADRRLLADILHMETIHDFGYARLDHGVEIGLQAAAVFEDEGALWDLCSVLAFVAYLAGALGRGPQAAELADRVEPLAGRLGHLGASFLCLAHRIRAEGVMTGGLAVLESMATEIIEVCERGGLPWLYLGHVYRGFAAHWRGAWADAERHLRTAVELEAPGAFSGQSVAHLAVQLAYAGRPDDVLEIFSAQQPTLPLPEQVNTLGAWNKLLALVEALHVAGWAKEAAGLYPLVQEALALGVDWMAFDGRLIGTRAALAAASAEQWDIAETHFAEALASAERLGNVIEQADIRRFRAQMLLSRGTAGGGVRAAALLQEAIDRYRAIGMPRHEAMARALLDGE